jgi:hypothetical protein
MRPGQRLRQNVAVDAPRPIEVRATDLALEAPQGAGHHLTAAALALQDHMNSAPLCIVAGTRRGGNAAS